MYRREFARLIWRTASPKWNFDDATFDRSAASFDNPDHVAIAIHNYRWRLGLAEGEARYEELEKQLAGSPLITVPTITLEGDANGAPHPDPSAYAAKFSGPYSHRTIEGGIGHNLPQEAPEAFADAILEVGGGRMSLFGIRHHAPLPAEGYLPGFDGATGWLNSPPLTAEDLRGKVVLVDFWTYTCINWLRTLGYVRAWAEKYRDAWAGRRRRPHAGVPVREGRRQRSRGRGGNEGRVPDRTRPRLRGLERIRQPVLAGRLLRRRRGTDPAPPVR